MSLTLSCDSIEKHRATIEALAGNWGSTTEALTTLMGAITEQKSKMTGASGSWDLAPELLEKFGNEDKSQLTELSGSLTKYLEDINGVETNMSSFMGDWQEKSGMLKTITDGLASGKLPEDFLGTIGNLQESITSAESKIGEVKEKLASTTSGFDVAMGKLQEIMKSIEIMREGK